MNDDDLSIWETSFINYNPSWQSDFFSKATVSTISGITIDKIKNTLTEFKEKCRIQDNDDLISTMIKNEKLTLLEELEKKLIGG